ncbi:ankyrin repeat domain-containing protein [Ekhidna sp.]|uniref:ankyrin repeat domain-containing protein n=1 Tax=Ekhidna sp. TaxID=2608089 RepID=UPI003BA86AC0
MKLSKVKTIKSSYLALLLVLVFSFSACNSKGQNDSKQKTSLTNIHEAAFMGNIEAIKAHVDAKSDLNEKDAYGSSPLAIATIFNKPEVARALIEGGADINIKSADGSTPLHSAAFFCRKDIVAMLLNKGADKTARNNYGSTALESISAPFEDVKPFYDQISRDLGPLGLKLDYQQVQETRPVIVEMIKNSQ